LRTEGGEVLRSWPLPHSTFAQGSAQAVGDIEMPLDAISSPAKLNLRVESPDNGLANDWDIWVFPAEQQETGVRGQGAGDRSQESGVRGGRGQGAGETASRIVSIRSCPRRRTDGRIRTDGQGGKRPLAHATGAAISCGDPYDTSSTMRPNAAWPGAGRWGRRRRRWCRPRRCRG